MSTDGITPHHIRCERVPPLHQPDLDERWLLAYIRECPEALGLGDLVLDEARLPGVRDKDRVMLHTAVCLPARWWMEMTPSGATAY